MSQDITFSVDGWTAGVVDAAGVDWWPHDPIGGWFDPVEVRAVSTERPTEDGTYSEDTLRAARVITIPGHAECHTEEAADAARDQFNALLDDGALHWLRVVEPIKTRGALVRLGAAPNLEMVSPTAFDWQLTLVAPDPRKFSDELHTASTGLASDAPGGVLWGGPDGMTGVQWGGSAGATGLEWQQGAGVSGLITLANTGTTRTPVRFTIAGPVIQPSIVDSTRSNVITYGGTVDAGSTLVIDTGTRTATLDGANRRPLLTRADWFTIPKRGAIDITFRSSMASASAALYAAWRDAWK